MGLAQESHRGIIFCDGKIRRGCLKISMEARIFEIEKLEGAGSEEPWS